MNQVILALIPGARKPVETGAGAGPKSTGPVPDADVFRAALAARLLIPGATSKAAQTAGTVADIPGTPAAVLQGRIAKLIKSGASQADIIARLSAQLAESVAHQLDTPGADARGTLQTIFATALAPPGETAGAAGSIGDRSRILAQRFIRLESMASSIAGRQSGQQNRIAGNLLDALRAKEIPARTTTSEPVSSAIATPKRVGATTNLHVAPAAPSTAPAELAASAGFPASVASMARPESLRAGSPAAVASLAPTASLAAGSPAAVASSAATESLAAGSPAAASSAATESLAAGSPAAVASLARPESLAAGSPAAVASPAAAAFSAAAAPSAIRSSAARVSSAASASPAVPAAASKEAAETASLATAAEWVPSGATVAPADPFAGALATTAGPSTGAPGQLRQPDPSFAPEALPNFTLRNLSPVSSVGDGDGRTVNFGTKPAITTGGDTALGRVLTRATLAADARRIPVAPTSTGPSSGVPPAANAEPDVALAVFVKAFEAALKASIPGDSPRTAQPDPQSATPVQAAVPLADNAAAAFVPPVTPFIIERVETAAAAAPAAVAVPVDHSAIADQVLRGAFMRNVGESSEIRLSLVPDSLGDVSVKLVVTAGSVTAHVLADTPEVRDALVAAQPQLTKSLADAGLKLASFTVDLSGGGFAGFSQPGDQSQNDNRSRRSPNSANDAVDETLLEAIPSFAPSIAGKPNAGDLNYLV